MPTVDEIAGAFLSLGNVYVEFDYTPLEECRRPMTPSKAAEIANTEYVGPIQQAKGFLRDNKVYLTKAGNWTIFLQTMNRRVKNGPDKGRYKWRQYRVEGINLDSVLYNAGPSRGRRVAKIRLFDNAEINEAARAFS